jgi:hypothetical protein
MRIQSGSALIHYAFDVGDEIHLDRIEKVAGESPAASRLHVRRTTPPYVQYRRAPLQADLPPIPLDLGDHQVQAAVRLRIHDFGVVSVTFRIPVDGLLADLSTLAISLVENPRLQQAARAQVDRVLHEIGGCVVPQRHEIGAGEELEWEDYAVFVVRAFTEPAQGSELLQAHDLDLARLLRAENERLSETELKEATRQPLSYYADELLVVDWNAAFFYDPRDSQDVLHVLEYAVAMLLELRIYDGLLDRVLDRAYDDLERKRTMLRYRLRPLISTLNYLAEVKLEVSELVEKVTNSLKLVGDPYLARVYNAAAGRFHLSSWEASVREKLGTVEALYGLLHDQTQNRLMVALEVLIVVLFAVDITFVTIEFFTRH